MRVLYVSTEVHPALKTGGLADVNGSLPPALRALGVDVRLLLPAFPALDAAAKPRPVATLDCRMPWDGPVRITRGDLSGVPAYLVDVPALYAREGNPYIDEQGREWPDNATRFGLLGWAAARFADGTIDGWRPDIVHGHDWHAGLAPAWLAARGGERPASVFTVHNLAFQGLYPAATFPALGLPDHFFSMQGIEYYGSVSFLKAGLHYADRITTVSPSYAREILTPEHGAGMDGLLRSRSAVLSGILNGIDRDAWSPATDAALAARYSADAPAGKIACRAALETELGLATEPDAPLFCVVSRLTSQKGMDLLLGALPDVLAGGGRLALVGTGDAATERAWREAAERHAGRLAVHTGFDEALSHRVIAGADVILVPSRFEPCGLTQMYGLAYGTLPLARRVGGLADTIRDAAPAGPVPQNANGFLFSEASVDALRGALQRACSLWREPATWSRMQQTAMREDHGWGPSALRYRDLYRELRPHADDPVSGTAA